MPVEFQGQKGLAGSSPWGRKEPDATELPAHFSSAEEPRTLFCVCLEGEPDPPQSCTLVSLQAPPLSLHPRLSLISNGLKGSCTREPRSNLQCFSFGAHMLCCWRASALPWHPAQSQEWKSEQLLETECQWAWSVLSLSAGLSG